MENILSVEDQNFLENIYKNFGVQNIICDESGLNFLENSSPFGFSSNESSLNYLTQIFKKLKYRMDSNFRMEFYSAGFNIAVLRN
ncbi:hypothetical protein [Halpernia frigidisoli]|uniref:Uncharacterized protein n=1 Tax=Halpernia frigidisoli TaxID=1125876 RepID=A0A1I3F9D6_9FLAO|nr:hypothetical protein [Halpernia frigidisoli]SFI07823.1 hypothetical protein SAMN05443292_1233 [Halpernia frigidisoli]